MIEKGPALDGVCAGTRTRNLPVSGRLLYPIELHLHRVEIGPSKPSKSAGFHRDKRLSRPLSRDFALETGAKLVNQMSTLWDNRPNDARF